MNICPYPVEMTQNKKHQTRFVFYLVLSVVGLITAWVFNGIASVMGANYLLAWFGTPVDWVLSLDLLIVAIAGAASKGFVRRIVIADIIMIATGYLGEVATEGTASAWIFFLISSAAWVYIVWAVFQIKLDGMPDYAASAVRIMRRFVMLGWAIYPIGTATEEFMKLSGADVGNAVAIAAIVYVIADVLNKVGFGIIAVSAAKKAGARQAGASVEA